MVSDPYLFGQIAAANAVSDVYAMGGKVISALNIVTYPSEEDYGHLGEILRGGAEKIHESNAVLSGGHSIHDPEIKYGLSVTGVVHPDKMLRNDSSSVGDVIILTKPLGTGIITTGYNAGELSQESYDEACRWMTLLNRYASEAMTKYQVNSATDVTGFGLLGHLSEMVGDRVTAELFASEIPYLKEAYVGAKEFLITAGAQKNRNYVGQDIKFSIKDKALEEVLFDPQTSGGLLISLPADESEKLMLEFESNDIFAKVIGRVVERKDHSIIVNQ